MFRLVDSMDPMDPMDPMDLTAFGPDRLLNLTDLEEGLIACMTSHERRRPSRACTLKSGLFLQLCALQRYSVYQLLISLCYKVSNKRIHEQSSKSVQSSDKQQQ